MGLVGPGLLIGEKLDFVGQAAFVLRYPWTARHGSLGRPGGSQQGAKGTMRVDSEARAGLGRPAVLEDLDLHPFSQQTGSNAYPSPSAVLGRLLQAFRTPVLHPGSRG